MALQYQPSLLDLASEADAGDGECPDLGDLGASVERTPLASGAWVDLRREWVSSPGALFRQLLDDVPWRSERRPMYDRVVDVPRLVCFYGDGAALPNPLVERARLALGEHYGAELGEPFATVGMCCYRDGRDSVAWHGDTRGRGASEDTIVAIVSLGETRRFLLRPRGGGTSLRFEVGSGDLLVMGGSCQRSYEHSIPKTARPVGPRISVQFRPSGVS